MPDLTSEGPARSAQGRARGLYDEQLQRQQQEKRLAARKSDRPALLQLGERPGRPRRG